MNNLKGNALMQEMSVEEMMSVNGGWDIESAAITAAAAACCTPALPVVVVAAFVVGGFIEY